MRKYLYDSAATRGLPAMPAVPLLEGQPFVLDEAFRPVRPLNAWLAALPSRGCHSPATWSGYADDLIAWTRFLDQRGVDLLDSTQVLASQVAAYRELRLQGDPGTGAELGLLGASAWNRSLSAMENFYSWAVETGLTPAKPFRYKTMRVQRGTRGPRGTVEVNLARAKDGSATATVRSLASDWADMFVDVGMGGRLPSGPPDPAFRGRSEVRNRALAALVRTSGLRRAEFTNLLVWEVPKANGAQAEFAGLSVPRPIAKGAKSRSTWASNAALELVADYVGLERALATSSSTWRPTEPLIVQEPDQHSGVVNGKRVQWSRLSIRQRRRLVGPDGGSALLFVRSTGAPLDDDSWREVFMRATARCQRFDERFPRVTPHMLRHTFALETLDLLTRQALSRAQRLARVSGADPMLMAILRRNDPLLILRDMLGHESVKTTEVYLKAQDPTSLLTDAELAVLDDDDTWPDQNQAGAAS